MVLAQVLHEAVVGVSAGPPPSGLQGPRLASGVEARAGPSAPGLVARSLHKGSSGWTGPGRAFASPSSHPGLPLTGWVCGPQFPQQQGGCSL